MTVPKRGRTPRPAAHPPAPPAPRTFLAAALALALTACGGSEEAPAPRAAREIHDPLFPYQWHLVNTG